MKFLTQLSICSLVCLLACSNLVSQTVFQQDDNARIFFYEEEQNYAYLGIESTRVTQDKAEMLGFDNRYGSYVKRVIPGTVAEKTGIQVLDYIYGIDDYRTSRNENLTSLLKKFKPGDRATLHLVRKGKEQTLAVEFGSKGGYSFNFEDKEEPFFGVSQHGINSIKEPGVRVNITPNSTAQAMGLRNEDIIHEINGYKMVDFTDISIAIDALEVGENIEVVYERNGKKNTGTLPIKSRAEVYEFRDKYAKQSNERAFLGINFNRLSKQKAEKLGFDNPYGSYITSVSGGSAADKAKLQPFDYIYGIDEYRVGENQNLGSILRKYWTNEEAKVYFIRKGDKQSVNIKFVSKDKLRERKRERCEDPFFGVRDNSAYSEIEGVSVRIVKNSTASKIGMQDGDVITAINDFPMLDWDDISTAINMLKVGEEIKVNYVRGRQPLFGSAPIKSECDKGNSSYNWRRDNDNDNDNDNNSAWEWVEKYIIKGDSDDDDDWDWDEKDRSDDMDELKISDVNIQMQDISREEATQMRSRYGVNMSTDNDLKVEEIELFPNPSMGMFKLSFKLVERGQTLIRTYNDRGRLIYEYDLGNFSGTFSDELDISQNGSGTYFLEIRQGNKSMVKKVILQNK